MSSLGAGPLLYDKDGKICQNVPKSPISTGGAAVQQNNNSASVCEWITPFVVIPTAEAEGSIAVLHHDFISIYF